MENLAQVSAIEALNWGSEKLKAHGFDSCRGQTEMLLASILDSKRIDLYLDKQRVLEEKEFLEFKTFIEKRSQGVPLQYLIGTVDFFGLNLEIEPGVFIPRPETETLVERLIDLAESIGNNSLKILDLCAGSGSISLALTKHLGNCKIIATDINQQAIELARRNAQRLGLTMRTDFLCGDLFEPLGKEHSHGGFDIIVANPPYIPDGLIETLPVEVGCEPENALSAGIDGLDFFRRIIQGCRLYLKPQGFLAFESGEDQQDDIGNIIAREKIFDEPHFFSDLNGIERFLMVKKAHG